MTDPVPYEPAENIPPIVVKIEPGPWRLLIVNQRTTEEIDFKVTVRDYNLDDTLQYRVVGNELGIQIPGQVLPQGQRDREIPFQFPVTSGPLTTKACSQVYFAVSDRGWKSGGPPYYNPDYEADGTTPTTVPAIVQWWIWVNDGTTTSGPAVTGCGP